LKVKTILIKEGRN